LSGKENLGLLVSKTAKTIDFNVFRFQFPYFHRRFADFICLICESAV